MTKLGLMLRLVTGAAAVSIAMGANAQKLPTATSPAAYLAVGGTYSGFEEQYPDPGRVLGGAGVYVDLNVRRNLGIEGEVRWLRQNQLNGSNQTTYLVGPRFELHRGRFLPYAKAMVGDGKLVFPVNSPDYYGNFTVVAFGGGLDVNLTEKIKLRLFDFEYQDWPKFNFGYGPITPITPYGLSAGISYRVAHTGGWPKHRYK